ncbi:H-NS family nucleoid-associated regulatory protein [Caballeronia mineralivorans]|jgi:DNA-binding protein H-NS|uniref:H-NS family nucleoid-associated regulatory protein n=1 Tax=Caballeronia mineralivorans TaxID=2010198 RepID=UPI0023F38DB2|nr:H-NS family nucleoid-associated regulatory protein [Caballeronia mineralivorans]MDB5782664.1 histone [Caballeronia mineralivorans]
MPTLEQIQANIKKLQVQADALIAKKAQAAVDQIRALMLKHGLTTEDIEAKAKAKREAKAVNGSAPNAETKASSSLKDRTPPKYQHPKTGGTWTGHGRAPAWIAKAKDRTKFLIASGVDAAHAASVSTVSKVKTATRKAAVAAGADAHRGQRTGPQPAKYLDPKTGAKWSGRGPAPAWLAAAKDRSKFLIAGADRGSADAGSAASKASKPKSSAVSGAVETKAATKKVVAKKAVAKKVAAKNAVSAKAPAKKATPAGKTASAKKAPSKSAAVTTPAATVATGTGSTT